MPSSSPLSESFLSFAWLPFMVHSAMWSQYVAVQTALMAPCAEWQTAWLRACGLPVDCWTPWPGAPVGGEPLP